MSTVEILRAAKALIDTPEKWCKYALVQGAREPGQPGATAHCALGALIAVSGDYFAARRALLRVIGEPLIAYWNNASERTHAEVIAAFVAAAENEEAREQEFNVTPLPEPVAA